MQPGTDTLQRPQHVDHHPRAVAWDGAVGSRHHDLIFAECCDKIGHSFGNCNVVDVEKSRPRSFERVHIDDHEYEYFVGRPGVGFVDAQIGHSHGYTLRRPLRPHHGAGKRAVVHHGGHVSTS